MCDLFTLWSKKLITTVIDLGMKASQDYMLQAFDGDERLPDLIAALFDKRAAENDSTAELCISTSSVRVDMEELNRNAAAYDDEYEADAAFHDQLQTWLEEAYEKAGKRWMNEEI